MPVSTDAELSEILEYDTIAVVGCSSSPGKEAHRVPKYLVENGYTVIPVNPYADKIFDQHAYDTLSDVEEEVDVVDIFRPSEEVDEIVDEAVARDDVKVVWMQLGIENDDAAAKAEDAGIVVVQNRCMKIEHGRLVG